MMFLPERHRLVTYLQAVVHQLRQQPNDAQRVLRLHFELQPARGVVGSFANDPLWQWGKVWQAQHQNWFLLDSGRRGYAMVATHWLQSQVLPASPYRFQVAEAWRQTLNKQCLNVGLNVSAKYCQAAPALLMAFAFDPSAQTTSLATTEDVWSGLAGGRMVLPQRLLWRPAAHEPTFGVLSVFLTAHTDAAALAAQLLQDIDTLQQPQATLSWPHSPAQPVETQTREPTDVWQKRLRNLVVELNRCLDLRKVVLVREFCIRAPLQHHFAIWPTLCRLRAAHPTVQTFAFAMPELGTFMGATPESLVRVQAKHVWTHALAGTAAATQSGAQHLRQSPKDLEEHRLVVEDLVQRLRNKATHIDYSPVPDVLCLPHLVHFETQIHATTPQLESVLTWGEILHPTPAVGGYPADAAKRYLQQHEHVDRGLFAGPLGFCTLLGEGELVVALRSALIVPQGDAAYAFAGAGILKNSQIDHEYDEIMLKFRAICQALWSMPQQAATLHHATAWPA